MKSLTLRTHHKLLNRQLPPRNPKHECAARSLQEASELMAAKGPDPGPSLTGKPHRVFPGNARQRTLSYPALLDPFTLAQINCGFMEHPRLRRGQHSGDQLFRSMGGGNWQGNWQHLAPKPHRQWRGTCHRIKTAQPRHWSPSCETTKQA